MSASDYSTSLSHIVFDYTFEYLPYVLKKVHASMSLNISVNRWFKVPNLFSFIKFGMLGFDFHFLLFILRSTVC
jgi:hypothetical protein